MTENRHFQRLTKAALGHMLTGTKIEDAVVQLLAWKEMPMDGNKRYRVVLSDGIYTYQCCIIMGSLASKIQEEFDRYCLLKISKYMLNEVQNRAVIVLHDLKLVMRGSEVDIRLGKPVEFGKEGAPPLSDFEPNPHLQRDDMAMEFEDCSLDNANFVLDDPLRPESSRRNPASLPDTTWSQPRTLNPALAIPIYALNQYSSSNWIIKGRCTSKTNKRSWNNARGSGTLFAFDLKDSKDDIRITAFKEKCEKEFDKIKVGEVYLVSGGSVQQDNKKYSRTTSIYKISLSNNSVIEPCADERNCPPISYDFRKIDQLRDALGSYLHVIAIIKSVGSVEIVKNKKTKELVNKRDLMLLDDSKASIVLTLWDDTAINFIAEEGDVLVARELRVSEFNGIGLSATKNSFIEINPQSERAFELKSWYNRVKDNLETVCLTEKFSPGSFRADWRNLRDIHISNVGDGVLTLQTKAVIVNTGRTTFYKGCKECNKKLLDLENGLYRCGKCCQETAVFNYRLILSFSIGDHTCQTWVQAFHDDSMKLLGEETNLEELYGLYTNNLSEFENRIRSCNFSAFIFKLRSKVEVYNDESRIRSTVDGLHQVNYAEYANELLRKIREN